MVGSDFSKLETSYIRTGAFVGFEDLVFELGGDPHALMKQVGIDPRSIRDPDNLISLAANIQIEELAARSTGCDSFGFLWGRQQGISVLGAIGRLARHLPDCGSALRSILKYMHLHAPGLYVALTVDEEGMAYLVPQIRLQKPGNTTQYRDHVMAVGCNVLRALAGADWTPELIYMARRPPAKARAYAAHYRADVIFDADFTGIMFDSAVFAQPLPDADPYLADLITKYLQSLGSSPANDVVVQVEKLIFSMVGNGSCTIEAVARNLSLNKRTLQRKLAAANTSFQTLLDKVRSSIAFESLAQTGISMSQLSVKLGYSEQSAFNRAFKRWFGDPPLTWSRRQ